MENIKIIPSNAVINCCNPSVISSSQLIFSIIDCNLFWHSSSKATFSVSTAFEWKKSNKGGRLSRLQIKIC